MSLVCSNLSFSYGSKQILNDVSFQVKRGQFCAILGRNGSGKSTLLSCLCGLLPTDSGSVSVAGQDMLSAGRESVARMMSLVPQEHGEIFPFSVLDVVVMGRTAYLGAMSRPSETDYAAAGDILKKLSADHLAHRNFNRISGGERQCVLLARALLQTRETLLMDEPTNHLDFNNQYSLLSRIRTLCRERGTRVVATLHDPNLARIFADTVVMLKKGTVIAQGPCSEVMRPCALSDLYETPTRRITTREGLELFLPEKALEAPVLDGYPKTQSNS